MIVASGGIDTFSPTASMSPFRITTVPCAIIGPETGKIFASLITYTDRVAGTPHAAMIRIRKRAVRTLSFDMHSPGVTKERFAGLYKVVADL